MKIWCDCDGVLADFSSKVKEITGLYPNEFEKMGKMWSMLARTDDFFYILDLMPDAQELYDFIKDYDHAILTGTPMGKWAPPQKVRWAEKHFPDTKCHTCMSKDKHLYCNEGDILIDDMEKAREPWVKAGGIFILHTSTENTIKQLKELL